MQHLKNKTVVKKIVRSYKDPTLQFAGEKYKNKGHLQGISLQEYALPKFVQWTVQLKNCFCWNINK